MKYLLILLLFSSTILRGQNTLQGEARIVPEAEANRQSAFINAETDRILERYDKAVEHYKAFLRDNPDNDAAWYGLAKTYFITKEYSLALDAIGKAIQLDPENEWYAILQADVYEKTANFKNAAAVYESLSKKFPAIPAFYEKLAYFQVLNADPKAALKTLDKLETIVGFTEDIASKRHVIYLGMNDDKKAAQEIQRLIDANPKNTEYRHRLANFYNSIGKTDLARQVYADILKIDPTDPVAKLSAVAAPKSTSADAAYLNKLGPVFSDPSVAIDAKIKQIAPYFEKLAAGKDPELTQAMIQLGNATTQAHPADPKAWSLAGDVYYLANQSDEALSAYNKCIELNGYVFSVWNNTLEILRQKGRTEELYTRSEQAIDNFPNQAAAYYFFGVAATDKDRPEEAIRSMEQALLMTGSNQQLKFDLQAQIAAALIRQKKFKDAADRLEPLLTQGADRHAGVLERYGDAQYQLGNSQKAKEYWQKAAAIDPSPAIQEKINTGKR